jgi:hypothetical protein
MRLRLAWIATLFVLVACNPSSPSGPSGPPTLGVANGTTLNVSLFVNGRHVGDYPPGGPDASIDPASLPSLPWTVEARSPSGRVLTSMTVATGQVSTTTGPGGETEYSGTLGRVDLSCGRLTIWAGDVTPSGPAPPPSPGQAGDCAQ